MGDKIKTAILTMTGFMICLAMIYFGVKTIFSDLSPLNGFDHFMNALTKTLCLLMAVAGVMGATSIIRHALSARVVVILIVAAAAITLIGIASFQTAVAFYGVKRSTWIDVAVPSEYGDQEQEVLRSCLLEKGSLIVKNRVFYLGRIGGTNCPNGARILDKRVSMLMMLELLDMQRQTRP